MEEDEKIGRRTERKMKEEITMTTRTNTKKRQQKSDVIIPKGKPK